MPRRTGLRGLRVSTSVLVRGSRGRIVRVIKAAARSHPHRARVLQKKYGLRLQSSCLHTVPRRILVVVVVIVAVVSGVLGYFGVWVIEYGSEHTRSDGRK